MRSTLDAGGIAVKKISVIALLMIAVLLVPAASSFAWVRHGGFNGHGHGVVVVGPRFGWGWGPYWGWGGYYGGYYPPPYYYPQPQVYVQPAPIYADSPAPPESYWYYCASTKAYYPSVPSCSEAWIKVPPRSE